MKYFTANWAAINKVIASDDTQAKGLIRQELKDLQKKIDEKFHAAWKEKEAKKKSEAIQAIKNLPVGSLLYYIGNDNNFFGKSCEKIKDGRTRLVVKIEDTNWSIPYECLQIGELTTDQKISRKIHNRLIGTFKNIM